MNHPKQSMLQTQTQNIMSPKSALLLLRSIFCLLFALTFAGCGSLSGPGSASFASVTIHKHTMAEIRDTTEKVFREEGYAGGLSGNQMVFDREASRMSTISRDGLVAAQSGAQTIERVRVELVDLGGGSFRLQCQAYMVSGAGDAFFAEEHRLANVRSGPYRSLLNKVEKQLK